MLLLFGFSVIWFCLFGCVAVRSSSQGLNPGLLHWKHGVLASDGGPFLKSLLNLLQYCFCFLFWFFCPMTCGILAPRPGSEPIPPALEGEVLTPGPPGKSWGLSSFALRSRIFTECFAGCDEKNSSVSRSQCVPKIWQKMTHFRQRGVIGCLKGEENRGFFLHYVMSV